MSAIANAGLRRRSSWKVDYGVKRRTHHPVVRSRNTAGRHDGRPAGRQAELRAFARGRTMNAVSCRAPRAPLANPCDHSGGSARSAA